MNLAPLRDPALVLPAIAQTLNITERAGEGLAVTLASQLAPSSTLLVLDNLEQVAEAAADIAALLEASPQLKILATSRTAMYVYGEHLYHVPPLQLAGPLRDPHESEAVTLFLQRAQAAHAAFRASPTDLQAIADICARLDGLPLAIELAAARIRVLPPAALLARLSRRLALLTSGPRNLPERQQTLRNAIDWSYELLEPAEQVVFRRLSVFAGGCTLAQAGAVCDESIDIVEALGSLIDKSLLQRRDEHADEPRFAMLETVREYAAERLEESPEAAAVHLAHARLFLDLAEQAEPELNGANRAAWLTRLDAEDENLRAALAWTLDGGARDIGVRIAGALWRFWATRGYLTEGQQWLDRALDDPVDDVSSTSRAKALNGAGNIARSRGDGRLATVRLEESLSLRGQLGDLLGVAASLINLGNIAFDAGDFARSIDLGQQALALYRAASDDKGAAMTLNNIGIALREDGRLDEAAAVLDESLALRRAQGDRHAVAQTLENIGRLALEQDDPPRALALFRESLTFSRDVGDRLAVPLTLEGFASVAAAERDLQRAVRLWGAAEALRDSVGLPMPPHRRRRHTAAITAARTALGDRAFEAAWAAGRALSVDEAVSFALDTAEPEPEQVALAEAGDASGVLSPREREVAALIAAGLTSREIAERLVISERTADSHADHIRQKLELRSRAEIAAWAIRQGLS